MNLGMPEMIFIFLLALVVFGPRKLPELGRQLGKALAEFKKASNEFKNQLEVEMMNIELEESAKKQQEAGPKLLPAEKLFDSMGVPPVESIPRGALTAVSDNELAVADPTNSEAESSQANSLHPVTPEVPSHNV
jgi:TatA/E family protein of Tat protein translocase